MIDSSIIIQCFFISLLLCFSQGNEKLADINNDRISYGAAYSVNSVM